MNQSCAQHNRLAYSCGVCDMNSEVHVLSHQPICAGERVESRDREGHCQLPVR